MSDTEIDFGDVFTGQKEFEDILFMSFRYALPRHTHVVHQVSMYVAKNINKFTAQFLRQMTNEIGQHLRAEMNRPVEQISFCDYNAWSGLNEEIKDELSRRIQA